MADAYYDYNNGLTGNDGLTPATAKSTRTEAQGVAGAGEKVIAVDGTHALPALEGGDLFFDFDDNFIESSESYRGATLQPHATETTRCARSSGTGTPRTIENLVFDGQANGGLVQAFDFVQYAVADRTLKLHGCEFIAGNTYGFLMSNRRGRLEFVNAKISGVLGSRYLGATSSLSGDGNQVIDIQGLEIVPTAGISGSKKVIELSQVATPANTLDLYFKGLSGIIPIAASATVTFLEVKTKDTINVAGANLTFNADTLASTVSGIVARGNASGAESADINITNNIIAWNVPVGHCINFGLSTVDSHITGGVVAGNKVTGKVYTSATPHNITMGQGTVGELRGNESIEGYVGYLLSITDNCQAIGNLAYDCYGPSMYIKGTVLCTVKDNVCVVSTADQRDRGILSVAPQGATNTAGATIQENLVIVQTVSKIHSLAYIEDVNQVCTFVRNTYIIPDTVDISTENLFSYKNGAGGAANNTLAQWNAQSEVTDDVIVQMPDSEIAKLIQSYNPDNIEGSKGYLISPEHEGYISKVIKFI